MYHPHKTRHNCDVLKNISIHPRQKGLEFPAGGKCMKFNQNFQGVGVLQKIHSVGEVWIFSRTTYFNEYLLPGIEKPSLQILHSPSSCLERHSWLCHNHSHTGCTSEKLLSIQGLKVPILSNIIKHPEKYTSKSFVQGSKKALSSHPGQVDFLTVQ